MLLPDATHQSAEKALRNICIYNIMMFTIVMAYLGLFLWIFFTWYDVLAQAVLSIDLGFRILLLSLYVVTVIKLNFRIK